MQNRKLVRIALISLASLLVILSTGGCNIPDLPFLSKQAEQKKIIKVIPEKPIPDVSEAVADGPAVNQAKPLSLNKTGQAGCLVCHADKLAVAQIDGQMISIYIDQAILKKSPHAKIGCLDCHVDFSYTHEVRQLSYKKIAGLACKNCHDHSKQNNDYRESSHGKAALGGDEQAATCADCHGSHDILRVKKSKSDRQIFRTQAKDICGKCHKDYWESYDDYYHGRAYKRGAEDAPACWDCHDAHKILPAKDSTSKIAENNIGETCGACHQGSTDELSAYVPLIHGQKDERGRNIVFKYVDKGLAYLSPPATEKQPAPEPEEKKPGKVWEVLGKVRSLFFPESLRPRD